MKHVILFLTLSCLLMVCDSESLMDDRRQMEDGTVVIGPYMEDNLDGDPFELRGAAINSNRLVIDVAYSGGCAQHDFAGFTPNVNILIYPPQITVFVVHDGNDDLCEAYPNETVELDISTLIDEFGDRFRLTVYPIESASKSIVLDYGE